MTYFIYSWEVCSDTLWQKSVTSFDSHQRFVVCSHSSPEVLQCVPQAPEFGVLCFGRRLRVLLDLNSTFLHQHGWTNNTRRQVNICEPVSAQLVKPFSGASVLYLCIFEFLLADLLFLLIFTLAIVDEAELQIHLRLQAGKYKHIAT